MSEQYITHGSLFDLLELAYRENKMRVYRIPHSRPLAVDMFAGEAFPIRTTIDYDEYERVTIVAWKKR